MFKSLVLMLTLLFSGSVLAADSERVYAASTTGELVVDTEGRVIKVTLDHKALGAEVIASFERLVRDWRFEPVLIDGKAVVARAGVRLDMRLKTVPGSESLTLEVRSVWFGEPPGAGNAESDQRVADAGPALKLTPPSYPSAALFSGVGGNVSLLVRIDGAGRVTEVATHSVELLGGQEFSERMVARHGRSLMKAAEKAARTWSLPGLGAGTVKVPVRFRVHADDGRRWTPIVAVPHEPPARMADEVEPLQLSESGQASSDRFNLISAINGLGGERK